MATPNTKRNKTKSYCDLYSTPAVAVLKLLGVVDLKQEIILEPCAGVGNIANELMAHGLTKPRTMDLFNHEYTCDYPETDFLSWKPEDEFTNFTAIVTNPPYKLAREFILHGFEIGVGKQYHLLRLGFLEGKRRQEDLFSLGFLDKVFVFTERISCPEGVEMKPTANSVAYAWFCFDVNRNTNKAPEIGWI